LSFVDGGNLITYQQGVVLVNGIAGEIPDAKVSVRWADYKGKEAVPLLNKKVTLTTAGRKDTARRYLSIAGVPTPQTWYSVNDAQLPCIARPPYHYKGRGFGVIEKEEEKARYRGKRGWYYSEIYPKTEELRVHVGGEKVLSASRKPIIEGELRANMDVTGMDWEWVEVSDSVAQLAIAACKALKMDFGAVDIMLSDKHRHKAVVCEVNVFCGVTSDRLAKVYADYFLSLC
jgi:glutathione synthase/RimK-type ligase-like ATP-grasp enzyme